MLKNLLRPIVEHVKLCVHMDKWRKSNIHNKTIAMTQFPIEKVTVGKFTYGPLNILYTKNDQEQIKIGNFCSIAKEVKFIMGGGHEYNKLSTYPLKKLILKKDIHESTTKGTITVCDDVWIGNGALILSGVTIGQGAIIGAGSIVSKDVPPYAIYGGNRVIKYRFTPDIIRKLLKMNFNSIDEQDILNNIDLFYSEMGLNFFKSTLYNDHILKNSAINKVNKGMEEN